MPKSNLAVKWTPIFEWCVVRLDLKTYNKKMCLKET